MTTGLVSPVFVGRDAERGELLDALGASAAGTTSVVLIGGEAGVGKSRLVDELVTEARARGAQVLMGHCVQLGSDGLPFAPLVDALRALARTMPRPEFDRVLGPARRPLLRLLPTLDLDPASTGPEVSGPQLLELVLGVVERLSESAPVLVVVEDLHWADQSTLELLAYLVRTMRGVPVALVGTFRSDELPRSHPLRALLGAWERARAVRRVDLERFGPAEVASQVAAILGDEPDRALVHTVFDRSDGNAFLVEELLGVVRAGGDPTSLPPSLRDLLLARVDALGPDARRILRTAAVGGRWVSEQLLIAVSGLDDATAFDALRETMENQLLVVDGTGRGYAFRHALARDAVYDEMLPGERSRWHSAYGEVLTAHPELAGDDPGAIAADLAHHWYAALDLPRALGASVRAAEAAAQFASAEALRHLERALQLWPRVPDAEAAAGIDQVEVLQRAAHAAFQTGALDRCRRLLDQGLRELGPDGDGPRRALLLQRKAQLVNSRDTPEASMPYLHEALACLSTDEVTVAHAIVLVEMAHTLVRTDRLAEAGEIAARAVDAARASGAAQQQTEAELSMAFVRTHTGDHEAGLVECRAAIGRALAGGYTMTALRGYILVTDTLEMLGRSTESVAVGREGLALARQTGHAGSFGTFLAGNLVESLVHLGRWSEAQNLIDETLASEPEGIFAASVLEVRAQLDVLTGNYERARAGVAEANRLRGGGAELQFDMPLALTTAEADRATGDVPAALGVIRGQLRAVNDNLRTARYAWPLVWLAVRSQADLAEQARERGAEPEPLDAALGAPAAMLSVPNDAARGYQAMVAAEAARHAGVLDLQPWEDAVRTWRSAGRPWELAYSLLRLAEVHVASGDRAAAQATALEGRAIATGLGATPLIGEFDALARRGRLALDPTSGAAADPLARFALTSREREVLQMLVEGLTNPEIAQRLFISPKTASVHVSNILAKLHVTGRNEAAALVRRATS